MTGGRSFDFDGARRAPNFRKTLEPWERRTTRPPDHTNASATVSASNRPLRVSNTRAAGVVSKRPSASNSATCSGHRCNASAATPRLVRRPNAMTLRSPRRGRHVLPEIHRGLVPRARARCTPPCPCTFAQRRAPTVENALGPEPQVVRPLPVGEIVQRTRRRAARNSRSRRARNPPPTARVSPCQLEDSPRRPRRPGVSSPATKRRKNSVSSS